MVFQRDKFSVENIISTLKSNNVSSLPPEGPKLTSLIQVVGANWPGSYKKRLYLFIKRHREQIVSNLVSNGNDESQFSVHPLCPNKVGVENKESVSQSEESGKLHFHVPSPHGVSDKSEEFKEYEIVNLGIDDVNFEEAAESQIPPKKVNWSGEFQEIGDFLLPEERWEKIWNSQAMSLIPHKYSSVLLDALGRANLCNCVFLVKSTSKNQNGLRILCYCAYRSCSKAFKILSRGFPEPGFPLKFSLSSKGHECHLSDKKIFRHVSGFIRDEVKKSLSSQRPFNYRREQIRNNSEAVIKNGNVCAVRPSETIRKISSEYLARHDTDKDVLVNALNDWKDGIINHIPDDDPSDPQKHIFLREVAAPMRAYMGSIEELQLFETSVTLNSLESKGPVLYLDATSSVVQSYFIRNVTNLKSFYYVLCFKIGNRIITLASSVLSQHDSCRITQWLLDVKVLFLDHSSWPIKDNLIVLDGSYPLLYGVLTAFNNMSLVDYLNYCHKVVTGFSEETYYTTPVEDITIVRACCSHKMKNFSDAVGSNFPTKEDRQFLLRVLGALCMCRQYGSVKIILEHLFTLLWSKFMTSATSASLAFLQNLTTDDEVRNLEREIEEPVQCDYATSDAAKKAEEKFIRTCLYQQSPFYIDACNILLIVDEKFKNEKKLAESQRKQNNLQGEECLSINKKQANIYHKPDLVEYLLKNQIPTLCLWTGIMTREDFPGDPIRFSNSIAECRMKNVKVDILAGQKSVRLNRFYRAVREETLDSYKEIRMNLHKITPQPNPKRKRKIARQKSVKKKFKRKYLKTKDLFKEVTSNNKLKKTPDFPSMSVEERWQKRGSGKKKPFETYFPDSIHLEPPFKVVHLEEDSVVIDSVVVDSVGDSDSAGGSLEEDQEDAVSKEVKTQDTLEGSSLTVNLFQNEGTAVGPLLLGNGLSADPNFYQEIAILENKNLLNYPVSVCCSTKRDLVLFSDFNTLSPGRCLNGFIMDSVTSLLIAKQHSMPSTFVFIPTIYSSDILNGTYTQRTYERAKSLATASVDKRFYIFFHNVNNDHWCLYVADLATHVIYLYDPERLLSEQDIIEAQFYTANLEKFVESSSNLSSGKTTWEVLSPEHLLQSDKVSCGVFCLFYTFCIIKDMLNIYDMPTTMLYINGSSEKFSANAGRLYFKKFLLENSENVLNLCAACGGSIGPGGSCWTCTQCMRRVHKKKSCLTFRDPQATESCHICRLCKIYVNKQLVDVYTTRTCNAAEESVLMTEGTHKDTTEDFYEETDRFRFQEEEYLLPAKEPEIFGYCGWSKAKKNYIKDTEIPLFIGRNPFPSPQYYNRHKPWCFSMLSNGLVDQVSYYIPIMHRDKIIDYTIGLYNLPNLECAHLTYLDFHCLNENVWLEDMVLDILASLFLKFYEHESTIRYIPLSTSKKIMVKFPEGEVFSHGSALQEIKEFPAVTEKIVFFHHLNGNHWCLIIIDRLNSQLLYIDPIGGQKEILAGTEVLEHLNRLNSDFQFSTVGSLKLRITEHAYQTDSINCGIFCLYFLEKFLIGNEAEIKKTYEAEINSTLEATFDPVSYRHQMQRTLLWHSEDLSDVCYVCGIIDIRAEVFTAIQGQNYFIKCMDCERLIHMKQECLHLKEKVKDLHDWEPTTFYCIICRKHKEGDGKDSLATQSSGAYMTNEERLKQRRKRQAKISFARDTNSIINMI